MKQTRAFSSFFVPPKFALRGICPACTNRGWGHRNRQLLHGWSARKNKHSTCDPFYTLGALARSKIIQKQRPDPPGMLPNSACSRELHVSFQSKSFRFIDLRVNWMGNAQLFSHFVLRKCPPPAIKTWRATKIVFADAPSRPTSILLFSARMSLPHLVPGNRRVSGAFVTAIPAAIP